MLETSQMKSHLTLRPIGFISSPFKQKFGTPRQSGLVASASATIYLDKVRTPAGSLEGLEEFSHIWVVFGFHQNNNETVSGKVHPPRLKGQKMGLFATRSPHRPNPLGLSLLQIHKVDSRQNQIEVWGADLIDGTPIYDIKPYIQKYDHPHDSRDGWTQHLPSTSLSTAWSDQANSQCTQLQLSQNFKKLVEEVLALDPRNLEDRRLENKEKVFKMKLHNIDVHFQYYNDQFVVVGLIDKRESKVD